MRVADDTSEERSYKSVHGNTIMYSQGYRRYNRTPLCNSYLATPIANRLQLPPCPLAPLLPHFAGWGVLEVVMFGSGWLDGPCMDHVITKLS